MIIKVVLVLLILVTIFLAFYYAKLLKSINAQKREVEENRRKHFSQTLESLHMLFKVIKHDQCSPTEGCIRVMKLYETLPQDLKAELGIDEHMRCFLDFYEEVKDFDYLKAYQDLTKQEKYAQDTKRLKLEEEWGDRLKENSGFIVNKWPKLA